MKKLAMWSGILGAVLFVITSVLAGTAIEGYSHISQYISESYATGIPKAEQWQNLFKMSGVLLFFFGIISAWVFPKNIGAKIGFVLFAVFYGLGTLVTGIFPCDLGCLFDAENASLSQIIHNAAGGLTYTVVPFSLLLIGLTTRKNEQLSSFSKASIIGGVLCFVLVMLLFSNPDGDYIGLFQRIIELTILAWVVRTAIFIKKL